MRKVLLFVLVLSITASILAQDADATPGTFHVPSFEHTHECRPHISKFNIFSNDAAIQTKCGGNFDDDDTTTDGVACGDSRRPWCSNEGDQLECVETKPTDDLNIEWAYSLPTMAELTECLNDTVDCVNEAWKTSIPTATLTVDDVDSTIQCLPTPNDMPTFDCSTSYTDDNGNVRSIVPNIASIRPAQWNSCGVDPTESDQAFYCTNPSRPYCHVTNAAGLTINACLDVASASTDGNAFDFSTWETSGDLCFRDLSEFDMGTFMMELKLWTFDYIQKGEAYTDFKNALDVAITAMKDSVVLRDIEGTYNPETGGLSGIKIKLPINCPPPPSEPVPDAVLPCLGAAASAKRISQTVAYIDNIKVDHTLKEDLKTKDYRMISEMTECSSGKKFPCNEEVLFHKPNVSDYSLHCFVENQLMSSINVDFSCFKKGFLTEYYNEYKNYLEATAIKWIAFIEKNIFPRELCDTMKFQDSETFVGYANKDEFFKSCLVERSKLTGRDETLICGGVTCCDNAETHQDNLVCTHSSIDHSKGTWAYTLTNGTCVLDCDISDLELAINFNYVLESAKTGETLVETENDVTGLTTSEM